MYMVSKTNSKYTNISLIITYNYLTGVVFPFSESSFAILHIIIEYNLWIVFYFSLNNIRIINFIVI